ncbi:XTP/dITP diphosphatase [Sulfuracidifex tepidarius]|uniref:dITP/XTP pyrophosphatase n=1 Tax=Sulfuracidifex tepidarius TaxID=1294262 RepID=A0A510E394_9CREN|nr:Non-canonical purine NTP pyrophosphatase [Sulfuracidifex tepidarius]BBG26974.1 Non-canonical purine NTP pyrophosphatase [Sulfuracidifex tepidarius]
MKTIKLITGNEGKFKEMNEIAEGKGVKLEWINCPKVEVQADTIEEISLHSAIDSFLSFRSPLIVDDSGLFVDALNGFPGPYTKFVRKTIGIEGMLRLLSNVKRREANFETVITFTDGKKTLTFHGDVEGKISEEAKGVRGFGFDPIFIPNGSDKTFAEMEISEKNKYSHRARAFLKFLDFFLTYNG